MGQKVHPIGFRLGFNKTWNSYWYNPICSNHNGYTNLLKEDFKIREYINGKINGSDLLSTDSPKIYRQAGTTYVLLNLNFKFNKKKKRRWKNKNKDHWSTKKFQNKKLQNRKVKIKQILDLKPLLELITNSNIKIFIRLCRRKYKIPYTNASHLGQYLTNILTESARNPKRFTYLFYRLFRVMKEQMKLKKKNQIRRIKGFRIKYAGKLWSKGRAKSKFINYGPVSLHNLKEIIDYSSTKVITKYGVTGFKVWLNYSPRRNYTKRFHRNIINYKPFLSQNNDGLLFSHLNNLNQWLDKFIPRQQLEKLIPYQERALLLCKLLYNNNNLDRSNLYKSILKQQQLKLKKNTPIEPGQKMDRYLLKNLILSYKPARRKIYQNFFNLTKTSTKN
jgi:small subunit ribosomal protein S3